MIEAHYCVFCGCVCVTCVQLGGCDDCELKLPQSIDSELTYIARRLDSVKSECDNTEVSYVSF